MSGVYPARLVFLDESGVTTEMTRRYGRAPSRERLREATPAGHWRTLTLLGALTSQGMLASMTVESSTDGEVFLAYLEEVLCPCLQPGQVVIATNGLRGGFADGLRAAVAGISPEDDAGAGQFLSLPYPREILFPSSWLREGKIKARCRNKRPSS